MPEDPSSARAARGLATLMALLLAAEWLLFAAYVRREVAWAYAPHFDQTMSLNAAYRTYEDVRRQGLAGGLSEALRRSPPSGALLHLEAAALFLASRPSRLTALAVNFGHFALLQAALVYALWATSRRWELALLGLGLLLAVRSPFSMAGGLFDFRPDSVAFSLYGTFLAAVWRSGVFRDRGWSLGAGAVGAVCALSRSLTAVYLGGLLAGTLAWLAVRAWREREPQRRTDHQRRLMGAGLCAACWCLTALPLLAVQTRALWSYYVVGHLTGPERAVRAAGLGLRGAGDALLFYPRSVLIDHAGPLFLALAAGSLAALAIARRPAWDPGGARGAGGFFAAALLVPLAVLTADTAKSGSVGGLLVTPLLWLVLAGAARQMDGAVPAARRVLAVSVLAAGLAAQAVRLIGPAPMSHPVEAVHEVLRLHDGITRWCLAHGLASPVVFADRQRDYVPALRVSAYERQGTLLRVDQTLARTVWRPGRDEILEALRRADVVILTRPRAGETFAYPYDEAMSTLYPRLLRHAKQDLVRIGSYRVPEEVAVFARAPAAGTVVPDSLDASAHAR
jgi:hypothetical protein